MPAEITISGPAEVSVSEAFEVAWTGPDYSEDFIGVGIVGASGSAQWKNYTPTAEGSPLTLRAPAAPGDYVIKYFFNQENWPAFEVPLTVVEPQVSLTAPSEADVSQMIEVAWTGPNYDGDYIGIGKRGASGSGQWRAYGATADGAVLTIALPDEPGDYLIQYFVSADRTAIAERALTIR